MSCLAWEWLGITLESIAGKKDTWNILLGLLSVQMESGQVEENKRAKKYILLLVLQKCHCVSSNYGFKSLETLTNNIFVVVT